MSRTTLHLGKQSFKFSAAHFLIFDAHKAERLHGHNYQVEVELDFLVTPEMQAQGYLADFNLFKTFIKKTLGEWDEMILLPAAQAEMKFTEVGGALQVDFRDRRYVFPKNEVVKVPVNNTSAEQLSRWLAEKFLAEFEKWGVRGLQVYVEETPGQGAATAVSKT